MFGTQSGIDAVTRGWLRGLVAAVVSASAHAVSAALAVNLIDPAQFNLGRGFLHTLELAGVVAVLNGVSALALYLSKSPLPEARP